MVYSILFFCFISDNILFHCYYYFITVRPSCLLTKVATISQHSLSNNTRKVGTIDKLIMIFTLKLAFVMLFTLFSDNISYHCFLSLTIIYEQGNYAEVDTISQYHNIASATEAEERHY